MLEEKRWEQSGPEVPENFHKRFEETLEQIERKPTARKWKTAYRVLAAAAAVAALGGGTVLAAGVFGWNPKAVEKWQPSDVQQEELVEAKAAQSYEEAGVTQDGVTVKLLQTLQDERQIYMMLQVDFPEGMAFSSEYTFDQWEVLVDGKPITDLAEQEQSSLACGGNFVSTPETDTGEVYEALYEVNASFAKKVDLAGKEIGLVLKDLCDTEKGDVTEKLAEGSWEFSWTAEDASKIVRTFAVEQTYDFGGYEILIQKIELSPLGYTVYADYESAMAVEEDERNRFEYNGDDPGMELDTRLAIRGVKMKDGTVMLASTENGDAEGETGEFLAYVLGGSGMNKNQEEGTVEVYQNFSKVLDMENVESVYLMRGDVEISLEG
ncbi:MAG: hypothetical protein Q4F41_08780 [Eubacteriales bacterium]|nr:hypothetical protein [Eubacteriales bacterium]